MLNLAVSQSLKHNQINFATENTAQTGPIDLVVTFVDDTKQNWQVQYEYYKQLEIVNGIQEANYAQAFHPGRYRNWDIFNYWFRSIEKNCSWINKIFLVVQDETQIPNWLDTTHPKLQIVYHSDYIPKELLPTYNGLLLNFFASKIPGLSSNFISCDDDYYFLNAVYPDQFFKHNLPCINMQAISYYETLQNLNEWQEIVDYNINIFKNDISKKLGKKNHILTPTHLFEPRNKEAELDFINTHTEFIINCFVKSHFRTKTSLNYQVLRDYLFLTNTYTPVNTKIAALQVLPVNQLLDFKYSKDIQMLCINDVDITEVSFEIMQKIVKLFFNTLFPEKSSFEK